MDKKYQYNKKPALYRFERLIEKTDTCWLWTGAKAKGGYGWFRDETGKHLLAHRWSYINFKGEIPQGRYICHKCDIPACVNPDHLWIGTALSNHLDAVEKGRIDNRVFKLGEAQVKEILFLLELGASGRFLQKLFKIRRETITRIGDREKWYLYFEGNLAIDYASLHKRILEFNYSHSMWNEK